MTAPASNAPRQRRRWGRTLLFLVLGIIGLIVVVLAILPYVLSLDSIKAQVITQAETALNRNVELGQVRLQIFTGLGAGLEQLTVSNPPGWQQPDFVKVDTLSIKIAFWPLLQRQVEVSKIILSDGLINVERDDKGRMNYDDLVASSAPSDTAKPKLPTEEKSAGGNPLANLRVGKVSLRNVDIAFIDRAVIPGQTHTTTAKDVQVDLENIGLATPIDFDISVTLLTDGDRNVRVQGQLGPLPETLAMDDVPLRVTTQVQQLQLAPLAPYLGPQPPLTEGQLSVDITAQGKLGTALDIDGSVALDKAVLPDSSGAGKPINLPKVALTQDATVNLATAVLQLTEARLDVASLQTTLKGTVKQFNTTPQLDLELGTNQFSLAKLLSDLPMLASVVPDSTDVNATVQLQASLKGNTEQIVSTSQINVQKLALKMADSPPVSLPQVRFSHEATIDMAQAVVQLTQANLDLSALNATLKGTVKQFTSTPTLDLTLSTTKFALGELVEQLPMLAEALPKPSNAQGNLRVVASVKGPLENLTANAQVKTDAVSLKSGAFNGAKQGDGMLLDLADMQTDVQATLASPQPPKVNLVFKAKRLVFDQQSAAASAEGAASKPTPPPPPASEPMAPPVTLRGKVDIAEGRLKNVSFQNLSANLSILEGLLKTNYSLSTFGGNIQGNMQANMAQVKPDYNLSLTLANMNAGNMVNEFTSVPNILFGRLNTDLQFTGKGFDWDAISTTLTGKGKLQLSDLKITSLDLMPKLANSLGAVSAVAGFNIPDDLADRSFDAMKANLRLEQGKIYSDDLQLWGPDVQLLGKGFLGLDQSLQFDGAALLLGKLAQSFGKKASFLLDKQGRIQLPVIIQGTVTQPKIALNESSLMDLARKALTDKVEKEATKELGKALDKAVPGLGKDILPGGGQQAAPGGAQTGQTEPKKEDEPLKQLEEGLKSLFKK
jgi:AsmA protein